jgi:hypothetical protein
MAAYTVKVADAPRSADGIFRYVLTVTKGKDSCAVKKSYADLASFHSNVIVPLGADLGVPRFPFKSTPDEDAVPSWCAELQKYTTEVLKVVAAAKSASAEAQRDAEERLGAFLALPGLRAWRADTNAADEERVADGPVPRAALPLPRPPVGAAKAAAEAAEAKAAGDEEAEAALTAAAEAAAAAAAAFDALTSPLLGDFRADYRSLCLAWGSAPHPALLPVNPDIAAREAAEAEAQRVEGDAASAEALAARRASTLGDAEAKREAADAARAALDEAIAKGPLDPYDMAAPLECVRVGDWALDAASLSLSLLCLQAAGSTVSALHLSGAALTRAQLLELADALPKTAVKVLSVEWNPIAPLALEDEAAVAAAAAEPAEDEEKKEGEGGAADAKGEDGEAAPGAEAGAKGAAADEEKAEEGAAAAAAADDEKEVAAGGEGDEKEQQAAEAKGSSGSGPDAGAKAVAAAPPPPPPSPFAALLGAYCRLTSISLRGNAIGGASSDQAGDTHASQLAAALRGTPTLLALSLFSNGIGDADGAALGGALRFNGTLAALDAGANELGDGAAAAFGAAFGSFDAQLEQRAELEEAHAAAAEVLDGGGGGGGDAKGKKAAKPKKGAPEPEAGLVMPAAEEDGTCAGNRCLQTLNLSSNRISGAGARAMVEAMPLEGGKGLPQLNLVALHRNGIGGADRAAIKAAEWGETNVSV